jgi:hypothetical protein
MRRNKIGMLVAACAIALSVTGCGERPPEPWVERYQMCMEAGGSPSHDGLGNENAT